MKLNKILTLIIAFIITGTSTIYAAPSHPSVTTDPSKKISEANNSNTENEILPMQLINVTVSPTGNKLSMYEEINGVFQEIISTKTCFIGKNGLDKVKESDKRTPRGVYRFIKAFGTAKNPGSNLPYIELDDSYYWIGDSDSKYYNQMVSINDVEKDWDNNKCEHLNDYKTSYKYALALDYNKKCEKDKGSAIFLHLEHGSGTAGCIGIPENTMLEIIKRVNKNCLIVIDSAN